MVGALQGKCPPHMAAALSEVIRNEGLMGLYRGWGASCLKVMPSSGITWMFYEAWKDILLAERRPLWWFLWICMYQDLTWLGGLAVASCLIAVSLSVGACIDMCQRDFASLRKKIITVVFDMEVSNLTPSSSQYIPNISCFSTMFLPVSCISRIGIRHPFLECNFSSLILPPPKITVKFWPL